MRDFIEEGRLPGRLMLAAGIAGLGLTALAFGHVVDGLTPFTPGQPWPTIQGVGLLLLGAGLAWPAVARKAAMILAVLLALNLTLHLPGLAAKPANPVLWVSTMEVAGLLAAVLLLILSSRGFVRFGARVVIGLMLVVFGVVHWLYVGAIAGMIPEWMPFRETWPWITGGANIAAGLALIGGVLVRTASALVGAMFASWIFLVHTPRLLATPGERTEWVALALAFALTGVVWTLHNALRPSGEDLRSSVH